MDTKSGYPWWTVSNGLIDDFNALRTDTQCEVAVIGAGITGSLLAHALSEAVADLPEGKMYKQFLPMVREKGGRVYVMPDDQTMEALDTEVILKNHIKEPALAELAAEAAIVIRF